MVVAALERAWRARTALRERLAEEGTDAFRLFTGAGEGVDGLVIDKYGPVAVAMEHRGRCLLVDEDWKRLGEWLLDKTAVTAVYRKSLGVDRSQSLAEEALRDPRPFAGAAAETRVTVHEHRVAFGIEPYGGFSTGLFLDQRENRHFLASLAAGRELLNCFAYTGGFSVAAARAGARTTSVDLSKKWLSWGRENFARNGLSLDGHAFAAEDVFLYFQRAVKRGQRFDVVVVDPPSFSRGKKGPFSVKKDIGMLAAAAAALVAPGGHLFISSNFSEWDSGELRRRVRGVIPGNEESLPDTPEDFRQQTSQLACCLFRIGK